MNDRFNRKGAQPVWKSHERTSAEKEAWLRPFEEDENLRMMDEEALAKARSTRIRWGTSITTGAATGASRSTRRRSRSSAMRRPTGCSRQSTSWGTCTATGTAAGKARRRRRTCTTWCTTRPRKKFLRGYDASFADAALRLGKVFEYGIGTEANPAAAYCLYLEADYAAKIRAEHSDFFGDHSVVERTGQALERVARKLPAEFFRDAL